MTGRSTSGDVTTPHDPHAVRTVGHEQARLGMFLGTWRVDGQNADGTPVSGDVRYEWLPGGFFIRGTFERRFGNGRTHIGISMLGFEPDRGGYFAHHYDNLGYARDYSLTLRGTVWTFRGRYERATITFSEDGSQFVERWESSKDGVAWTPRCELTAVRG